MIRHHIPYSIGALALLGLGIAAYSFFHNQGFVSGSFCDLSTTFSCDIVNRGAFSNIGGIPVALIGILGYLIICITAILISKHPDDQHLSRLLLGLTIGGFLFSLYLSSIEAFVLHTWCIVCLSSQIIMGIILLLAIWSYTIQRARTLQDPD